MTHLIHIADGMYTIITDHSYCYFCTVSASLLKDIVTYRGIRVTNNNGFWIWWLGLLALLYNYNYNSSHTELLLHDVWLTNLFEETRTNLSLLRMHESAPFLQLYRGPNRSHHVQQLIPSVAMEIFV
jgi:hypothetical protein